MERLVVVVVVAVLAALVAVVVDRVSSGRPAPVRTAHHVPAQLHRSDFVRPDAPVLVVVFTSASCDACAGVWAATAPLESAGVAVQQVEVAERADLHERYGIDGVPTAVVVDADGVVRSSFLGPVERTDLAVAVDRA